MNKKYDWSRIQKYYDSHICSYADLKEKFGVSKQSICKSCKKR